MKNNKQVPIFVLTMEKPGGIRRKHCEKEFLSVGLKFNFFEGVRNDNPSIIKSYSRLKNFFLVKRNLSAEEISCYLGHREIWKEFYKSDKDIFLVAEDDLKIRDKEVFKKIISIAHDNSSWDILKLFDYNPKPIKNTIDWNGLKIVDYKFPGAGTVTYLITRHAAKKLLSRKRIFRAIDDDFSNCWEFGLRIRSIQPNITEEVSYKLNGSIIEESRSSNKKIKKIGRSIWAIILHSVKQIRAKNYLRILKKEENDT